MTPILYEGTKRVLATPMTRGAYNEYRGWTVPANEDPADAGFLVEYQDGGKANDPRHAGYISWSPADVFERSYREVPGADLPPYQQRVLVEKAEVDRRVTSLAAFIEGEKFAEVVRDQDERKRLIAQRHAMDLYANILAERIAAF